MKINQCFFLIPIGLFAVFFDLRKGKIPNELIVIGLILGCCFQIRQAKAVGLLLFLGGACIPVVLGAGIYYFRMMGAGDMKLWAVVGGFLGPQRAVYCMIASLLCFLGRHHGVGPDSCRNTWSDKMGCRDFGVAYCAPVPFSALLLLRRKQKTAAQRVCSAPLYALYIV